MIVVSIEPQVLAVLSRGENVVFRDVDSAPKLMPLKERELTAIGTTRY